MGEWISTADEMPPIGKMVLLSTVTDCAMFGYWMGHNWIDENKREWEHDYVEDWQSLPSLWIPVAERMPEPDGWVLICIKGQEIMMAEWNPKRWGIGGWDWAFDGMGSPLGDVTHWMPLPDLPEIKP